MTPTSSPLARVRRARRQLLAAVALTALLRGLAFALAVIAAAAALDLLLPLPAALRAAILPAAALALLAGIGMVLWRGRSARSVQRVALWLEEREPTLRYTLVTAIDPEIAPAERYRDLHVAVGAADLEAIVRRGWSRPLSRTLLGALAAAVALVPLRPAALLRAAGTELARRTAEAPAAPMGNRLEELEARVRPPAYARLDPETLDDPSTIAALVGSHITITGRGPAEGISAALRDGTLHAAENGRAWTVRTTMPAEPVVLTLRDRQYDRLIVLEPRADSAPQVRLTLPASDSTYQQVPRGRLQVVATIADDIGIEHGWLEFMLTAGGGENFETKTSTSGRTSFGRRRSGTLRATIRFDTLGLAPGTVLHIRAIALDANDVTGPGRGVSDTRTLRIAEPEDSTSVNPVPPLPIDSMFMSQRLLNMRTDTLIRSRAQLERKAFVDRSSGYGNSQEELRQRALAVIGVLEADGVGGSFQTETSAKLRQAADLMWTARMFLGVAQPDTARPVMDDILEILDEIRLAHRYYLRGTVPPAVVNIERVRLTGEGEAAVVPREARRPLPGGSAALAARLDAAAALLATSRSAALDSLAHVRVSALRTAPQAAAALGRAMDELRTGAGSEALAAVRRALEPRARIEQGEAGWGGIIP
jgi:hypothetical protein